MKRKKKRKSRVQQELTRIEKYVGRQQKRYGDVSAGGVNEAISHIMKRYKSDSQRVKHLQELDASELKKKILITTDKETGETVTLEVQQSENRRMSRIKRVKHDNLYEDTNLPIKEEIELNNMGEEMAEVLGMDWQRFDTANYKKLRSEIDYELNKPQREGRGWKRTELEAASSLNNWLDDLVNDYGLERVVAMVNEGLGTNTIDRNQLFYQGGVNINFFATMLKSLGIPNEEQTLLINKLKEEW